MAPLLEQLKNFIRHGKNGKDMKTRDSSVNSFSNTLGSSSSKSKSKQSSRANSRNNSPTRSLPTAFTSLSPTSSPALASATLVDVTSSASKQRNNNTEPEAAYTTNAEAATRIVAEEKQQKSQMPTYPGLERYRLLQKMGDGAFSNVYKAHDTKMDRVVAIKVVRKFELNSHQNKHLHRDMKKKPRVTERANILKEVQIMRQLKHPGIIELYEFFESQEHYFLVLELASGGELFHSIVRLTYFSEDLTRHVIVQVAQGIRYLHEEKGVIHRDIKPENILFEPIPIIPSPEGSKPDEDDKEDEGVFQHGIGGGGIGRVKIADFGLSKVVWNEQTMTPCGTVGYTAPEIVKDERYSKSVDMWAMGCVLYTLLCGFPPFYDESIQALTEKVARGQYSFLSPWWDDISSDAKDLITHLLCVNPNERYTIDEFLAHKWIQAGAKPLNVSAVNNIVDMTTALENKHLSHLTGMAPEVARSPYRRRAENPLSPGIGLKEVFDVSNAVHRMEEESSRRRYTPGAQPADPLNTTTRQRQAFLTQLNEEEEDESGSGLSDGSMLSDDDISMNPEHSRTASEEQTEQHRLQLQQQQQEYQRAQEEIAAEHHQKYLQQQQRAGVAVPAHSLPSASSVQSNSGAHQYSRSNQVVPADQSQRTLVSASPSVSTIASTSTTSTTRRRKAGFELNIGQATLLNRRAKKDNGPMDSLTMEMPTTMLAV